MRGKAATLLLLFALLFNSGGYLGVFFIARYRARTRRNLRPRLSGKRLAEGKGVVEIEIPLNNPPKNFIRVNADELWYRGKMYDIVRVEHGAHTRCFYALADASETASLRQLSQVVAPHQPDVRVPQLFFSYLKNACLAHLASSIHNEAFQEAHLLRYAVHETAPPAPFIAVLHPPPWLG